MVELCLMASRGYAPDLGFVFPAELGFNRVPKENQFMSFHGPNQDLFNSLSTNSISQQKEGRKSTNGVLNCNFLKLDSTFTRPTFMDVQGIYLESEPLSSGIAEQCIQREKILKLLSNGSLGIDEHLPDLPMLCDLFYPQTQIAELFQFASDRRCFNDAEPQQSLIYPSREFYVNEPFVELVGDYCGCTEKISELDGSLLYNCSKPKMNDVFSVISALHASKKVNKYHKQTMLVPFFEWRKRAHTHSTASKLAKEKVELPKNFDRVKEKTFQRNKIPIKTGKERDKGSIHAFEILLSIIVNKNQQSKNAIHSLKKSGLRLPNLLTQFSASIAGAGIAVVLSVVCRVASSQVPLCTSRILSAGLGLLLISLSSSIHKLKDTVVSIGKFSNKMDEKEDEIMDRLERSMREIYVRVAALMAVAALKLV